MDSRKYTCDTDRMPRPATGKTPVRNLRVPDEIWDTALANARAEGRTITDVITTYLKRYNASAARKNARSVNVAVELTDGVYDALGAKRPPRVDPPS